MAPVTRRRPEAFDGRHRRHLLLTYAALAIGRIPGFRVNRTGAVLLGAIALIVWRIRLGAAARSTLAPLRCCSA
jgi:hypothetical protein